MINLEGFLNLLFTGSVVAGVVGTKMPHYCVFGEAVNVASKMEALGKRMYTHLWTGVGEGSGARGCGTRKHAAAIHVHDLQKMHRIVQSRIE